MATEKAEGRPQHVTFSPSTKAGATPSSPIAPAAQWKPSGSRPGTRRLTVNEQGQYTYKKTPSSTLMASLQLGLQHSIGSIAPKPRRDILMTDFEVVETVEFPVEGSGSTPAHKWKDFTFKTYCPEAMRFFRVAFGIQPEDYLLALCDRPLREVSNPGASGSLFYLSADDNFILKTVQKKEARFLQKLLPGYYLNLTQNKRTLLPKFFGLYRYKSGSVNIRIVVMNNLLPSSVRYHEKYDLKGSTYKRKASQRESQKTSPTFKDLDFMERHEEGIILAPEKYEALLHSVERDCKVLESFGIMDYSLLLGIHNIDQAIRDKAEAATCPEDDTVRDTPIPSRIELSKNFSIVSTEDIPSLLAEEQQQRHHYPEGYIQGRIHGDRVMFYLGIIDILQSYRLKKKLEHGLKAVIADGATVSVHNPSFYARRFQDFITKQVFKKDKTKFRTRKNSTNVQLRGRRPGAASTGTKPPALSQTDRQVSRDSRTSPNHDPPSYNQALHLGTGVPVNAQYTRKRAMSDTTSASGARSPPQAAAESTLLKKATAPSGSVVVSKTETTTTSSSSAPQDITPSQDAQNQDTLQQDAPNQDTSKKTINPTPTTEVTERSQKDVEPSQKDVEPLDTHSNEKDFARDIRGTSTPVDFSPLPSPNQNHTFNGDYNLESTEVVSTVEINITVEDSPNSTSSRRGTLRRESALEFAGDDSTEKPENESSSL